MGPFPLDEFQLRANAAIDAGQSVLVSAPTGAGKTVVAEHAVARALADGGKAFYTTPIKALSNQKFHDLVGVHGSASVGLLTGDNSVNGDAPVVVMTTEVLRNMIYAGAPTLEGLRWVILDEVHYLQDAYRGPVWEEVIVHLPHDVRLVCLSATVSNAQELSHWLTTIRGPTATVVEETRPVELDNEYVVEDRSTGDLLVVPTLVDGRANPEGHRFDVDPRQQWRGRSRRRWATPGRVEVIELLERRALLPAIYFIFSRAACEDTVRAVLAGGLRLTDEAGRSRIRSIVERHLVKMRDDDLAVLGYHDWLTGLEAGVSAHHAGMIPPFKEAVEACFNEGLIKVVFATETLALGINMPARSVVIEKLTKFTGERHEFLTAGQYSQLSGRAGRRGIDDHGHALVLWSPFVGFDEIASLAASRSFHLSSAFRPTYNMAANLVRRYPADRAHDLLSRSFAQYQADQAVVRIESRLASRRAVLAEQREEAHCELGDVTTYRALLDQARAAERAEPSPRQGVDEVLRRLKPGDVIWLQGGKSGGRAAVLSVAHRKGGTVKVRVITPRRRVLNVGAVDFDDTPDVLGSVELPTPFTPQSPKFQRRVSESLRRFDRSAGDAGRPRGSESVTEARGGIEAIALAEHPVAACPDRDAHVRAARQVERTQREITELERQVAARTESLARSFDNILQLLEAWGYLEAWSLTRRGEQLVRIYHEADLLVAEALEAGLLDGLDPATLAGIVSCFTYEHRSSNEPPEPWFPSREARERYVDLDRLAGELNADESKLGLPLTRLPDPGFVALAHAWTVGEALDEVLDDEELSGGDFVRNVKQLLDLLRQIGDASPQVATSASARQAAEAIFRGVVSAASIVGPDGDPDADPSGSAPAS